MKTKTQLLRGALTLLATASLLSSCGETESNVENTAPVDAEKDPLAAVFLPTAPAGATPISTALTDPQPGEPITISGEIMGAMNVLPDGLAMAVLGDPTKLTPCNRIPGDSCDTPWDVCCDPSELISGSIATIQIVDADGRPLKAGLKGVNGIKELSFLTVTGTVAEGSNPKNLLVNATGIHVATESPFKDAPPVSAEDLEDPEA